MAKVPTRQLGKNGPQVSAIGYGAMGLSAFYGGSGAPDEERFKVLDRAIELGCTYFDRLTFMEIMKTFLENISRNIRINERRYFLQQNLPMLGLQMENFQFVVMHNMFVKQVKKV